MISLAAVIHSSSQFSSIKYSVLYWGWSTISQVNGKDYVRKVGDLLIAIRYMIDSSVLE